MNRKRRTDDVLALRQLYCFLRETPAKQNNRGWSYLLHRRYTGPSRTTFLVNGKGEAIHLPYERPAIIAELRLLLLEQDYPLSFVATFDRDDHLGASQR